MRRMMFVFALVMVSALSVAQTGTLPIAFNGGVSWTSEGLLPSVVVGYARAQFSSANIAPAGMAIFGYRQNGVLISEAAVPSSPRIQSGRIYAEVSGEINTGVAFANPNNASAFVSFRFNGTTGAQVHTGSFVMSPNSQFAAFLDQYPFLGPAPMVASTMTFESTAAVSVVALRGNFNSRSEFLLTTLPVIPLGVTTSPFLLFPHFVEGGGWLTEIILVNPTSQEIRGNFSIVGQPGEVLRVRVEGLLSTTHSYAIPADSARRFRTSSNSAAATVGSLRVYPLPGSPAPAGLLVLSFKSNDQTVASETGVGLSNPSTSFRLYGEGAGVPEAIGSIQTGLAVANPSSQSIQVHIDLIDLAGNTLPQRGTVTLPGNGQSAFFLQQVPGLSAMPNPFQGIVRVWTDSTTGLSVIGLRGRKNERGEFLAITTPAIPENVASSSELLFPQFAEGGGYTTQFVMFSARPFQQPAGTLQLISQSGSSLNIPLRQSNPGGQ